MVLINGISVDFSYIVQDRDVIDVYASCENIQVNTFVRLRPESSLSLPKFLVDANLGRLARYLRLLGFDCLYRNDYRDESVAKIAHAQQRAVLTRDRKLLHRKIITRGYIVRAELPKIQLKEVLKRFNLYRLIKPLTRCTRCNGKLVETDKQNIKYRLQPLTNKYYNKFLSCLECGQIYWQGSHCAHVKHLVNELLASDC